MASRNRTHITGKFKSPSKLTPKHLTKQEFGRRLYQLMLSKGWRQSDLARAADIQRNAVSTYILGKALPTPVNLRKLATVFDITAEELLPNSAEVAIDEDAPLMSLQVSPGAPDKAWLRINQLVDTNLAVKIIGMLRGETSGDAPE